MEHGSDMRLVRGIVPSLIVVLLALASPASAVPSHPWVAPRIPCDVIDDLQFNGSRANASVHWQVGLGPRVPGSNASAEFRAAAGENLTTWGWDVEADVHFRANRDTEATNITNLVAHLGAWNGTGHGSPNQTTRLVLAAHYDTRDRAEHDANETNRTLPIPGANDGASGVAVLLELARLIPGLHLTHEVTLLFTDAEDWGHAPALLGAAAWAENLTQDEANRTTAFILLDMVGDKDLRLLPEKHSSAEIWDHVQWSSAALGLHGEMNDCDGRLGDGTVTDIGQISIFDDHWPLAARGVPVIDLIDFEYGPPNATNPGGEWWHTQQDTPDKVSAESLNVTGRIVEILLRAGFGEVRLATDTRVPGAADPTDTGREPGPAWTVPTGLALAIAALLVALVAIGRRWVNAEAPPPPPSSATEADEDG